MAARPATGSRANRREERAPRFAHPADLALAAGLFALALAVRVPYLLRVPRFTDEAKEIMWGLRIFWGEHLPLAGHNGYCGPVWHYLLAALFRLFGPSVALPRVTVLVAGALTVVATYALGRTLGGRTVGLIAGALLSTSFIPVYLNSHVAWSICTTPLLTTLALLTCHTAVRTGRGTYLVATGLLVGLAMQTHPLAALLIPPLLAWALWQPAGRALLRTRWPILGAAAVVLGYANMLWFHLSSRLETVGAALTKVSDDVPRDLAFTTYRQSVHALLATLTDIITAQGHHGLALYESNPERFVWAATAVLAVVLLFAARRGTSLPLVAVFSTVVLMPFFNRGHSYPLGARFLSFLLPVIYCGVGASAWALVASPRDRSSWPHRLTAIVVALALAGAAAFPLLRLRDAYRTAVAREQTNDLVLEMADVTLAAHRAGERILLSEQVDAKFSGGGHVHRVMATLLGLASVPFVKVDNELDGIDEQLQGCAAGCLLILAASDRLAIAERYPLETVPLSRAPLAEDGEGYGVYRYAGRGP